MILASIGFFLRVAIEDTIRANLRSQLLTLLEVERSMLETWLKIQQANAQSLAQNPQVRQTIAQILATSEPGSSLAPTSLAPSGEIDSPTAIGQHASLHARLASELGAGMSAHHFVTYVVADRNRRVVSSSNLELLGNQIAEYDPFLEKVFEGEVVITPPFASVILMKDEQGRIHHGVPTMLVFAPIRDANFQVIAALGLRIRPEREFTRIVQLATFGETGETYAVNQAGLFVSNSRFDDELVLLGLIPDVEGARSILTVSARDPGGNLLEGYRPSVRRSELPLTQAASAVVAGSDGINLNGYRDYRGVTVIGAWRWMPSYRIGLITEIDYAEAYRPLTILRRVFFSMLALLAASAVAIFIFMIFLGRVRREAQRATIEAKHLGQYRLEQELGAGAMGVVYKGHHAMLRRPTAIKLLNVDKVNEASIERFEREVQVTCKLNHPNTIAIYDYGRTPEGVFYYAMEYLDGIDLQQLVERYGPQPEGRVVQILEKICGSLSEAHSLGLVHRDIKPANIMLNYRGGQPDVVKVLDFGLVRALDDTTQTRQGVGIVGTPLYMSPEAIQSPDSMDARSDLYAVGAIGYFLLVGEPVFEANSLVELCQLHVVGIPESPSQRLGRPVSAELECALLACLEKNRSKRPQTARDLISLLAKVPSEKDWTPDMAEAWWRRHERSKARAAENETGTQSSDELGQTIATDSTLN